MFIMYCSSKLEVVAEYRGFAFLRNANSSQDETEIVSRHLDILEIGFAWMYCLREVVCVGFMLELVKSLWRLLWLVTMANKFRELCLYHCMTLSP